MIIIALDSVKAFQFCNYPLLYMMYYFQMEYNLSINMLLCVRTSVIFQSLPVFRNSFCRMSVILYKRPAESMAHKQNAAQDTASCCPQGHIGKSILNLSLAKLRWTTQAILKTYELFVYRDIHYITNLFCKNL
jgi:hypothetical protein